MELHNQTNVGNHVVEREVAVVDVVMSHALDRQDSRFCSREPRCNPFANVVVRNRVVVGGGEGGWNGRKKPVQGRVRQQVPHHGTEWQPTRRCRGTQPCGGGGGAGWNGGKVRDRRGSVMQKVP